jgi:hypothetical protein
MERVERIYEEVMSSADGNRRSLPLEALSGA